MPSPPSTDGQTAGAAGVRGREWRLVVALWVACTGLYWLTARAQLYAGDDMVYLVVARNWLEHGVPKFGLPGEELTVSKYWLGQILLDLPVAPLLDRALAHDPGQRPQWLAMLLLGGYAAAWGAAAVALLYLLARQLGLRLGSSLGVALLYAVATMNWPYSQHLFADSTMATALLLALWGWLRYRQGGSRWALLAGGLGVALLGLCKPTAAPLAAIVALAIAGTLWRRRTGVWPWLAAAGPGLLAVAAILTYNQWRYGTPWALGYAEGHDPILGFSNPALAGLFGLVASSGKGVLWYNPVLFLGLWGCGRLWRREPAAAWLGAALVGVNLALYCRWWAWPGDWAWGPRYLVVILPLLLLPAGFALERLGELATGWQRRAAIAACAALVACSVAVQLLAVVTLSADYNQLLVGELHGTVFRDDRLGVPGRPLRDDQLLAHYVPDFSPLAAQLWMTRVAWHARGDWQSRYQRPPWYPLNPAWVPVAGAHCPFSVQPWWLFVWRYGLPHAGALLGLAALLLALTAAAAGWLRREFARNRGSGATAALAPSAQSR